MVKWFVSSLAPTRKTLASFSVRTENFQVSSSYSPRLGKFFSP